MSADYSISPATEMKGEMPMAKKRNYEELDLTDDFMFGKVMEDRELCRETLECLLGHEIGELMEIQPQKQVLITSDGKPIRLDIYTRDSRAVYDAEMQNLNGKKVESLDLPKRSRFYQSSMDMDILSKGETYRELPESNVIFICTFDPFGKGYARYTFDYRCNEDLEIRLGDQAYKWFYNFQCNIDKVPDEMRSLYRYVQSGMADSELTQKLHTAVIRARRNEIWRAEYMKELLIYQDMKEEGREEGREEGQWQARMQIVCRKYVKGKTPEQIADDMEEGIDNIMPLYDMVCKYVEMHSELKGNSDALYEGIMSTF